MRIEAEKRQQGENQKAAKEQERLKEVERTAQEEIAQRTKELANKSKPIGLEIRKVEPDGNCLFRALAKQTKKGEESHDKLRAAVAAAYRDHPAADEPHYDSRGPNDETQTCEWGVNYFTKIEKYSTKSQFTIVAHTSKGEKFGRNKTAARRASCHPMYLYYYEEAKHYDAVKGKMEMEEITKLKSKTESAKENAKRGGGRSKAPKKPNAQPRKTVKKGRNNSRRKKKRRAKAAAIAKEQDKGPQLIQDASQTGTK